MNSSDVILIISIGTIIFFIIAIFITIFIFSYRQKLNTHLKEKKELENIFQNEILKAQLEMQEQTFRTISQEIHDNIGQILSLSRLNISTIKTDEDSHSVRKINATKDLLDKAIEDLRDLSKRLNPEFVSQRSLKESLVFQLDLIQRTELYQTTLEVHGEERPLDQEKKLIVYRIAQEALNNIIKHAEAKRISVLLMYLPNKVILSIKDDGHGLDAAAVLYGEMSVNGIGMNNMVYRSKLIGAEFSLQSKPGEGCLAQLVLPTD